MIGRLVSAALLFVAALGFCELSLQVAARFSPFIRYQLSPPLLRNAVPDPEFGFRLSPYTPGHDQYGYRNDAAAGAARGGVVAIGDSLTYGLGAFPDGAWPQQLARISGRPVYNAGVGGYGPCEYSLIASRVFALQPTQIVVGLYMGNDIGNAYASVYLLRRCREQARSDPKLLAALSAAEQRGALSQLAAEYGDTVPEPPGALDKVAVYALLRSVHYAVTTRNQLPNREGRADTYTEASTLPFRLPMPTPPQYRTVFRDPRLDLLAVDTSDARMAEGLRLTIELIQKIAATATARGATTLVVILHSKPFALASVIAQQPPDFQKRFAQLLYWEATDSALVTQALSARGIRWVETKDAMQGAVAGGMMPFHPSDDTHPTSDGYRIIAQTVAKAMSP